MAKTAHRLLSCLDGRSLVLVGLMGAGKSTIGKRVAAMLDLPFYDADYEIEQAARMTIADLFEAYGEPAFRDLERRVILRLLKDGPMVLATGGGAYMNEETRKAIADKGISVWLHAELDILMERVSHRQNRPLLKRPDPRAFMEALMAERYPIYALADIRVNSRKARRDVVARDVVRTVERYLSKSKKQQ
ncbi:shikimate kinase [uncultured Bartonella sp.]|uniref:shikimate kinase n=1 Tax=uncultured Bartonella sp. TaxID=104108 RepID=UPI0025F0E2BC|nr:shikimate kinase [uncultured Bartonella sp.]